MGLQIDLFTGELSLPPPSEELDQFFTRPKVARAFVRWSRPHGRVLEPSAGEGALLKPNQSVRWTAVEIDAARAEWIKRHGWAEEVIAGDFLRFACECDRTWDLLCSNPPYSNGRDADFVEAWRDNALSQRSTWLLPTNFLHSATRKERIWRWVKLTRVGVLSNRPHFTAVDAKDTGPKRDYSFFELLPRLRARKHSVPERPGVTWITT